MSQHQRLADDFVKLVRGTVSLGKGKWVSSTKDANLLEIELKIHFQKIITE